MRSITLTFGSIHAIYFIMVALSAIIPYHWYVSQRLRVAYGLVFLSILSIGGAFTVFRKVPLDGTIPYEIVILLLYAITMLIPTRHFPTSIEEPHRGGAYVILGQWLLYMTGFYSGVGYNFGFVLN